MSLKGFPRRTLRGDTRICRIHRAGRDPWWFSSDGSGRFDPVGTGHGACYFAERPLGAFIEVFRKAMLLAEDEITARRIFSVAVGRDLRLADLCSRRALSFGVTASLGANEQYDQSQAFARDALEAGFDGVRYLVRHDPAQQLRGIVVFSTTFEGRGPYPAGSSHVIPDALIRDAHRLFGYRVLPKP